MQISWLMVIWAIPSLELDIFIFHKGQGLANFFR